MGRLDKDMERVITLMKRAERILLNSDALDKEKAFVQGFMISAMKYCEIVRDDHLEWLSSGSYNGGETDG